jgi:integrase
MVHLGLIDYVEALRAAREPRLFPELNRDPDKGYGKPAGSWFNERLLGKKLKMERNGKKVFHSFRHSFATALERLDLSERVIAQVMGHQRGSSQSGTRYAKDREATELAEIIEQLTFPCLTQIGKFDVQAGLAAVKWAKRLKADHNRS